MNTKYLMNCFNIYKKKGIKEAAHQVNKHRNNPISHLPNPDNDNDLTLFYLIINDS